MLTLPDHGSCFSKVGANQWQENIDDFLGRMGLVAGLLPRLYIREWPSKVLRPSLGENVSGLVSNRDEALVGNIGLRPDNVTDRIESRLRPRMYKSVEFRVTVEADVETVGLEYPIEFGIRADDSCGIIVVC